MPQYRKFHKKEELDESETHSIINAALKYMEENLEQSISLHDLAEYTGYSNSHFSAIFKGATGHSPLSYFNKLKIKKACELLDTTNMKKPDKLQDGIRGFLLFLAPFHQNRGNIA